MASALKKLGFSVTLRTNADQESMEESIRIFGKQLRLGGVGLFYYAGHGLQIKGHNYLIPIGANIETESEVKYEAVDAGRVLGQMEDAGNGLNIIILDACRDNPYARSFRSTEKGLAKMEAPTGSFLAYATAPGSVAADGTSKNGLYTSRLLKHMMVPGNTIEKVFKNVRIDVVKVSMKRQIPWESSSLMGDFFFIPKRGISVEERTHYYSSNKYQNTKNVKQETTRPPKQHNYLATIPNSTRPQRRAVGKIKSIDNNWGFVIINLESVSTVKVGEKVVVKKHNKKYYLKIKRISGKLASAISNTNYNNFLPGMKVYKY